MIKTISVRVKDKHAPHLRRMAFQVNQAWNKCNEQTAELSCLPIPEVGWFYSWVSAFDLQGILKQWRKENCDLIPYDTFSDVARIHQDSRRKAKRNKLRWRVSNGARKSLGWIPFKKGSAIFCSGQIRFFGNQFKVWDSYDLSKYDLRSGSFTEDARGRWYFNVCVEVTEQPTMGQGAVGIDLGLKDTATCSDGTRLEAGRFYRGMEEKLARAQRAKNKKRTRAIHAKIRNRRKDALHKFSRSLVNKHGEIYVGNVSSSSLAKTRMAKSVLDAGWSSLKTMLEYKCDHAGIVFKEVNEAYTTRACSSCGSLSGPQGVNGLRIREWDCVDCGAIHDRDVNSALNILSLAVGHDRPAEGMRL